MNYVQFHLGDWLAGTALLSPTERGVYIDLLVRYYKEERPIMQEECKRIARAYTEHEQDAMQYVLQTFFTLDEDGYHHSRCDEEIAKARLVSEKRKKSANARWANSSAKKKAEQSIQIGCEPSTDAMQADCTCISKSNASGMLTNNQEPITNNQVSKEKIFKKEIAFPEDEVLPTEKPKKETKPRKKPVTSCPFTSDDEIPPEFLALKDKYPDVDVIAEFSNFVNFHTSKGNQYADWLAAFRTWLGNAKKFASERRSYAGGFTKPKKTPGFGVLLDSDPSDPSTYDQNAIDEVYRRSAERLNMTNVNDADVPF